MVKIVIAGATGRMGHALLTCARSVKGVTVAGAVERPDHPDLGADSGASVGLPPTGIPVTADLAACLAKADVLVDFTLHAAAARNAREAARLGKAVVLGTTGLDPDETRMVHAAAKSVPIVWSPNMSLGVNLLFAIVKRAAEALGPGYAVEIDETHHVHKKDAPSGTALRLGQKAADGLEWDFKQHMVHDPAGAEGIHDAARIVIRSHREGEIIGNHTVSFENTSEKIEFTHQAWSRDAFAMGALRAAQWIVGKPAGIHDMLSVLRL